MGSTIKHNALCPVCFQRERGFGFDPSLIGRRGKLTFFCSTEHVKEMAEHHLEQEEDGMLWEATVAACQYLDRLELHDMRYLSREQLLMFTSIVISKFAEVNAEFFTNNRKTSELNDEIPF